MSLGEQPYNFHLQQERFNELKDICSYEEDYFILALYNSIFYLFKASRTLAGFTAFYEEIENVNGAGRIKDVRDMRVHIDEYLKGKGGKEKKDNARFVYESPDELYPAQPFAGHLFTGDASSTIIFDGAYLIGGRINVQDTIIVLERLLPDIIKKCNSYLYPRIAHEENPI